MKNTKKNVTQESIIPKNCVIKTMKRDPKAIQLDAKKDEVSFIQFKLGIKNKHTRRNYYFNFDRFMIVSKISSYDEMAFFEIKKIGQLILQYVNSMKECDYATNTMKTNLAAIFVFFDMNDVLLNKKKLYKAILPDENDQKRKSIVAGKLPYTSEEIQRMLGATNKLRTKAVIHFFASTGSRPSGLWDPHLRMKHLAEMPHGCMGVNLYSDSNESYWSFLTPEAVNALDDYHADRKFRGEVFTEETPIFSVRGEKPMGEYSGRQLLKTTIKLAGIEKQKVNNKYDKAMFYGFRKRMNTILKNKEGVNSNIVEKMIGHKNGLDGVYYQPTKEESFNEFYKAVPELMIDQTQKQKQKIRELEEKSDKITNLEDQVSELKETLVSLMSQGDQESRNKITKQLFNLAE